nr:hypothetical protein BaRGS_009812 [Batillaria attramentaria]
MSRSKTAEFGDSTQQEMCFGFLTYYPAQAVSEDSCSSFRNFSYCDASTLNGCDPGKFWREVGPLWANISSTCSFHSCFPECKELILAQRKKNPCLANSDFMKHVKTWALSKYHQGTMIMAKLASCDVEIYKDEMSQDDNPTSAAVTLTFSLAVVLFCVMLQ